MMQIPMEILSQMMTRTDSGTGTRAKAGTNRRDSFQFVKAMEEALVNPEIQQPVTDKKPGIINAEKETTPTDPNIPDEDTDVDETLVAGMMGNQNMVVFILEGDKDSATTLEISADDTISAEPGATANTQDTVSKPEPAFVSEAVANSEEIHHSSGEANQTAQASYEHETAAGGKESAAAASSKKASQPEAADIQSSANSETRDVTARMPTMGTSEQQENEEGNSDFSGKGNLGPLENENDTTPAKGSKVKTYSETEKAVKSAAEGVPETANNTPVPLADGIKPEQFRADQQMKQTAPDAPVKAENLFDEMISRIETMKTESQSTMSIQLKPEFLGKVALEIAMDAAGLHVKISAADGGVRTMINGQINALIESLENKGIEVVEVEVAYTGVDNGAFKEPREDQGQPNRPRRSYREVDTIEGAAYYSALPFDTLEYYLDAGVSSVEYRA